MIDELCSEDNVPGIRGTESQAVATLCIAQHRVHVCNVSHTELIPSFAVEC